MTYRFFSNSQSPRRSLMTPSLGNSAITLLLPDNQWYRYIFNFYDGCYGRIQVCVKVFPIDVVHCYVVNRVF